MPIQVPIQLACMIPTTPPSGIQLPDSPYKLPSPNNSPSAPTNSPEFQYSPIGSPHLPREDGENVSNVEFEGHQEDDSYPDEVDYGVSSPHQKALPLPKPRKDEMDPNTTIREQFLQYVASARKNYVHLPPEVEAGVELMQILNKEGAPLTAYDKIMEWHTANLDTGHLKVTKDKLMSRLRKRYNMEDTQPYPVRTVLPHSKVVLDVPCHDAGAMLRDLLTDPRIKEEDYLFFNDDPTCPPPPDHEWNELRDINTGLAHRETYKQLIHPKPTADSGRTKVLIPVIPYMDACVTGETMNLSLEILKITLGIFNRKARNKGSHWRNLGAVPTYETAKTGARESIQQSTHGDAKNYLTDSDSEDDDWVNSGKFVPKMETVDYIDTEQEGFDSLDEALDAMLDPQMPDTKAQDLHVILHTILASYKRLQDSGGIEWDLPWKGRLHYLLFIPFVPFVKGDGVEHDKHCGKYGSRTKGVKQLCRYCCCPTNLTDQPHLDFPRKTKPMILELIRKKQEPELKDLSQSLIWNAWYEIRFGLHNDYSIHGGTPIEMIHWIKLGMYKYSRNMLFEQTGKGEIGKNLNICATNMGWLFQRQSEKSFPRTKFTRGVMKGKLMAHEFTGVILVLVAALRSSRGRKVIMDAPTRAKAKADMDFVTEEDWILCWITLLEQQLTLEAWLRSDCIPKAEAELMVTRAPEHMVMTKAVGRRTEGMGFNTMNYHGLKHSGWDMIFFGVPANLDTESDEMHHKDDKKSSKQTQKRPASFDIQSMRRIEDRRVIEFGVQELQGKPRWLYDTGFAYENTQSEDPMLDVEVESTDNEAELTGVRAEFSYNADDDEFVYNLHTQMKNRQKFTFSPNVVDVISGILFSCDPYLQTINVYSELKLPCGQIFRASSYHYGKPWYDWGMFRYHDGNDEEGVGAFPSHIRAFVDLRRLPKGQNNKYKSTIYIIAEPVHLNPDPLERDNPSRLFKPYVKQQYSPPGSPFPQNMIHIYSIDKLIGPVCVIPDLDNERKGAFLRVLPPSKWAGEFSKWLHAAPVSVNTE